jgi:hypothetical protein
MAMFPAFLRSFNPSAGGGASSSAVLGFPA